MKNIFKKLVAMIGVGLFAMNSGFAQSFAVQSSTQLIPPYSVYLSDYATPGNEKLQVILVQRDLTQPSYQVRLVMVVELEGRVIMRTSRTFNPRPISLDPGIPTVISGADLAPYLDSRNIDFVGYSRDQYERTKALPEGQYNICFIAYDYRRQDVQVSNNGCSFYFLSKNEPPLTNFPVCGNRIMISTPQQVIFSWFPRNTASPNSAADTEYEFTLFETRPEGRNPNDVVLTTQPVFRTLTDFTQLVYGPGEPVLFEGMTYVWRIRAIDKSGKDAFRNNGYSEVCTFRYGGFDPQFDIGVVKNLQALGEADRRGKIWWETGEYEGYKVEYKKSGKDYRGDAYEWHYSNLPATQGEIKIYDLEPDTEYQARVTARKNNAFGPYSEIVKFRTRPPTIYQCGENNLPQITPANPIASASVGMVVNARGFDMTLVEIMPLNQPGYYKGIGFINNKFFGGARFYTKFEHIFIDENRNVAGPDRIDIITEGVANTIQQQLADQKGRQLEQQQKENREQWADTEFSDKAFLYDEIVIENVTIDESGNVIITDANGVTHTNTEIIPIINTTEKAVIIEDKNGDQYVVQKDKATGQNKVTKVEGGGLQPGSKSDTQIQSDPIKDRIIVLILDRFEEEIAAWLRINGKGGEEDPDILLAEELPTCFVRDADVLIPIKETTIPYFREHPSELREKIESNPNSRKLFDKIKSKFSSADRVKLSDLNDDERTDSENKVCEALMELRPPDTNPITAKILAKVKEIHEASGKQVIALVYCKECKNSPKEFEKEMKGGEIILMQSDAKLCLGLLFKVEGDKVEVIEGSLVVNEKTQNIGALSFVLPTLGSNNKESLGIYNASGAYASCTDYLDKNFFGRFDYCTQEPTESLYDQLLTSIGQCINASLVSDGDIVNDDIVKAVDRTLSNKLDQEKIKVVFSSNNKVKELGEKSSPNLTVRYAKGSDGKWKASAQFSDEYIKKLAASPHFTKYGDVPKILKDFTDAMDELMLKAQLKFCDAADISPTCVTEQLRFLQVLSLNLESVAKTGTVHEAMWRSDDSKRNLLPVNSQWSPVAGGVVDEVVEEATAIPMLVMTIWEVSTDEEKKQAIKQLFSENGYYQMRDALLEGLGGVIANEDKRNYTAARFTVMLAFMYFALVENAAKSLDDAIEEAAKLTKKVENAPTVRRYLADVSKLGEQGAPKTKQLQELMDAIGVEKVEALVKRVEPEKIQDLIDDLAKNEALKNALKIKEELIAGWKVLINNPILRKRPENLENINKWIVSGVEEQKLFDGIAKSSSKQKLIDELGTAKSKLHVHVLVKDYDNIPGIIKSRYKSNSSSLSDKAAMPNHWPNEFDINERTIVTFTEKIDPLELNPGDKIYRVSSVDGTTGPYWTKIKPEKLQDVVGGTAVRPEWNNFEYVSEYTVPDGVTIKTWVGKTAAQPVSEIPSNYHLPGGTEQFFISFITKQDPNFIKNVKTALAEW